MATVTLRDLSTLFCVGIEYHKVVFSDLTEHKENGHFEDDDDNNNAADRTFIRAVSPHSTLKGHCSDE
jgi:hypothetical protein